MCQINRHTRLKSLKKFTVISTKNPYIIKLIAFRSGDQEKNVVTKGVSNHITTYPISNQRGNPTIWQKFTRAKDVKSDLKRFLFL
jgi:hypothetical protein